MEDIRKYIGLLLASIVIAIFNTQLVSVTAQKDIDLNINFPTSLTHVGTKIPLSVFLNKSGTILQASEDIQVSLDYDPSLLSLENDTLIIKKGNYYASTNIKILDKTGNAFIRASVKDPQLDTFRNVTISTSLPSKLQITVYPQKVIKQKDRQIAFFVSLLDDNNEPVVATQDVKLQLFSNNPGLDNQLDQYFRNIPTVIKKGEWGFYYQINNIFFQDTSNRNFVGALSPNYGLVNGVFKVVEELDNKDIRAKNQTIVIYQPAVMPPNATAVIAYQVAALKGSDKDQKSIDDLVKAGKLKAHAFDNTDDFKEGSVYPIRPDFDTLTAVDKKGKVVSGDEKIIKIIETGTLSTERSYGIAKIKSGSLSGKASISIALKAIGTGTNSTEVVNPLSPKATRFFSPIGGEKIIFNTDGIADLYLIALDANGRPTNSQGGIEYLLEPINKLVKIERGEAFTKIQLHSGDFEKELQTGVAKFRVTPVGADVKSSLQQESIFQIGSSSSEIGRKLVIFSPSNDQKLQFNNETKLQIFVDDEKTASVSGVLLEFTAENSTVFPQTVHTDETGQAEVLFRPLSAPKVSLTIHASKKGYVGDQQTVEFNVAGLEVAKKGGLLFGVPPWVLYVAIAGTVGGIAVVALRILRKPKQITEEEEAEI